MQFDAPLGTEFGHDGHDSLDILIVTSSDQLDKMSLNISDYQFLILVDKSLTYSSGGGFLTDTVKYRESIYVRTVTALKRWVSTRERMGDSSMYTVLSIKPVTVKSEITVKVGL